jgi:SWI/SNF-related matrix-associated actin-dependent regulator 1 of chromatin subfamily A
MSRRQPMIQDRAGIYHRLPFELRPRPALMPFQQDGAEWLRGRSASLLGDDMGLGKTCQAIEVINSLPANARVLICCPAGLRLNWLRELALWLTERRLCCIAKRYIPSCPIVVVSYDQLRKFEVQLRAITWELVICDEAHLIRNPFTIRCRQVLGDEWTLPLEAKRKILLTGTPVTRDAGQLWSLLYWLGLRMPRDIFMLRAESCGGWLDGCLRGVMLRRMKRDVLKDLPAKTRQIVRITAAGAASRALAEELTFERTRELERFPGCKFTETAEVRMQTALAKLALPEVQEHLREAASAGKIVVFVCHHATLNRAVAIMAEMGLHPLRYEGTMSTESRQAAVDAFQHLPQHRAIVVTIGAGSTGITLTAASHVIFLEETYDPTEISQAEDRVWRNGQKNAVLVQHLVLNGSIDCREIETQIAKQAVIDRTINSTP